MMSNGEEPHIVGECACYKLDTKKMALHPCIFIGETEFGGRLFCSAKKRFFKDSELPHRCGSRKMERKETNEQEW